MKTLTVLVLSLGAAISFLPRPAISATIRESDKPVLVELFTSEGCSDCPPADLLLTRLTRYQPVRGARIIALEEHISYWNNPVHWVDPFSSAQFTNRQYDYSARFNDDSPYTPEMVVDGSAHFVGSDQNSALDAISAARNSDTADITIDVAPVTLNNVRIDLSVTNIPHSLLNQKIAVLIAITQDDLLSHVTGGENRGSTLPHSSVARSLSFAGYLAAGSSNQFQSTISLPAGTRPLHAIAFLQETGSKCIVGVNEADLR